MMTPTADTAWSVLVPPTGTAGRPAGLRAWARGARGGQRRYIAVPSRRRPLIVASCDPAVLRYLADSVLTVPPGTGPVLSLLLTAGLRLLRRRRTWILAALLGAGGMVVGAAR